MITILNKLLNYEQLNKEESHNLLFNITRGKYNDAQIASLITIYLMRNISLDELDGFKNALMEMRIPIDLSEYDTIDIVGTGGDNKDTFNISTTASFIVAGAGYKVVKHGNYGSTSISGASNLIENCGVRFTNDINIIKKSLDNSNFAFLHAPLFNPAMKAVAQIRKSLGIRTFFNILGPLVNPAKPKYQLLGVYNLSLLRLYNFLYQKTNINYSVIHSLDGYDEISLTDDFKVCDKYGEKIYSPIDLGFNKVSPQELMQGRSQEQAIKIFKAILNNSATKAQINCVVANAAFAIKTLCPNKPIDSCINEAKESLISGKANKKFEKFLIINS